MTRTDHADQARCRPAIEAALRDDPVVWLSSVQRDGRPHLVPVWFHWDGDRIVAFSKPHARKVDNLRDEPRVMVAVGTPGPDFEVELIEATAHEVVPEVRRWRPNDLRSTLPGLRCGAYALPRRGRLRCAKPPHTRSVGAVRQTEKHRRAIAYQSAHASLLRDGFGRWRLRRGPQCRERACGQHPFGERATTD